MANVYIRPLNINDAITSYNWRNDADIWVFTGQRPKNIITYEIEKAWLAKVLQNSNEMRFAICLVSNNQYIGNVQLTGIENGKAEYHIFIGVKSCWGKGYAKEATILILKYAFDELRLSEILLEVHPANVNAINLYQKIGFKVMEISPKNEGFIVMKIQKFK